MLRQIFGIALVCTVSFATHAQVEKSALAQPPASATHYIIQSTAGRHGESWRWSTSDGTRMARESMNLRGQVWEMDSSSKAGADGMPARIEVRGVTPTGDAAETFEIVGARASWKSPVDSGSASYAAPVFYMTQSGPIDNAALFLEHILATPDKTLNLLPGGKARAEKLTTVEVGNGAAKQTATAWAITGVSNAPVPMWSDANGKFFGMVYFLSWLPEQYAGEHERLTQAQTKALAARAPALAKSLVKTPANAVAFTHVKLFDAEGKRFLDDQTVVVDKSKIVGVGPASAVKAPAGAQVIDGRGKMLLPGLWDCHMHTADDYTGLVELSMGVTSVRDPGNDDRLTMDRRARASKGELLTPHVYASSLIDGKGTYTAQVANVATSEAETVALVRKAKQNGFIGVKFYGTLDKAWLPAATAEAQKLGLHVHGHIPVGMRPLEAIEAGYDEITHINWIVMQAMPDAVIQQSNGIMRFEGPGRYAKDLDLDSEPIKKIISTMAAKGIYSDPTMVAFEGLYVPENGDLSPAYAAFVGTLPPTTERGFRSGGFAVPKNLTRADYRKSWAKLVELLGRMHAAGVPIVAGTDGFGIEIVRELEIYQQAGMTPAEALATATIVPAKLVGQEKNTGSISVGKIADLVLVEGDPSQRLSDLRQTRLVMLAGKLLDPDALREAAGFSGRPK